MKTWKAVFLALVLVSTLAAVTGASAQNVQRGSIRGFVYDTTHSVVPNAKVTIFNPSTGYKREFTTDATGVYAFDQLLPGIYQIKAEATGFASITLTDANVDIGSSQSLDITLPVKGQTTSVTVSASIGAVDTSTAGINQVINQRNLETLPLSGRDYRDLAELSSSAQVVPGLRGGIRLGGQQSDYSSLVIDGQDSFNNYFGEFLGSLETKNFTIPLESVQEFQVVTNGFAPEFGRATGGLINVITKSGTNQWHGEAHEYYRGSSLTKNDGVGNPPNISNQNQFGGSVGFPIRKDRQFLFVSADVQRENGPLVTQFCPGGPTQAACLGALADATGPTFANCTGPVPYGGNCTPGTMTTPGQVPFFTTSTAGFGVPPGCSPKLGDLVLKDCYGVTSLAGLNGTGNQLQNLFTILGHYDFQFSPANHFSLRSYYTKNHTNGFSGGVGQNEIPMGFDDTENFINKGGAAVFSLNTVLGKKVNEIRVSIQDEVRERHPNSMAPMFTLSDSAFPDLTVGSSGNFGVGQRYFLPINNQDGKFEAADNFDYVFGKHDIKFGGSVVTFEDRKDSFVGWSAGEYDFFSIADFNNGVAGFAPAVPGPPAESGLFQGVALNGLPLTFLGPATTLFPNYQTGWGMFWQDKWQVTPSITLTYGLRWDATWNPQPQTPLIGQCVYVGSGTPVGNSCADTFTKGSGSTVAPVPQRFPADFGQWGPRVGVAWNARRGDHPTVIRGAWGFYYASTIVGIFTPTAGAGNLVHCFFSCGLPSAAPGTAFGFPYTGPTSTNLSAGALRCSPAGVPPTPFGCPSYGSQGDYIDPNIQNPRVSSLTAGIEQTIARDTTLTVTYSFVHSTHLRTGGYPTEEAWARNFIQCGGPGQPAATDAFGRSILCGLLDNTVAPIGSGAGDTASFSHGNYHSVVVNITKRFSRHFQVFGNYIWSQNKDNASSERDTDTFFGAQDPFNIGIDYGRNGLDIKHQFKAAGVYELPWGFAVSSSVITHTGVPYPVYINVDVNGDGVANSGHNNDRPLITLNGKTSLLGRYPLNQPGFFEWDSRLQKDIGIHERYHVILSADFFNMTNRANLYSDPNVTATIDYTGRCTSWATLFPGSGALGSSCIPLTSLPTLDQKLLPLRRITSVAPGSTPFAFQAGVKFQF
jgi:Carboxypeptidase regulatory-like domain